MARCLGRGYDVAANENIALLRQHTKTPSRILKSASKTNTYHELLKNVWIIAPTLIFCSLGVSTLFYYYVNNWSLVQSFYYSTQAMFGCMYCNIPALNEDLTAAFTLALYIFGSTAGASAIGAFVSIALEDSVIIAHDERSLLQNTIADVDSKDAAMTEKLSIFHKKSKMLVFQTSVVWIILGVVAIYIRVPMPLHKAIMLVLAAVVTAGSPAPNMTILSDVDTFLLALYIIIGVPLFAVALGQISLSIVEGAVRAREREILSRPLTKGEFKLIRSLHQNANQTNVIAGGDGDDANVDIEVDIDLSDFIVLELLRLKKVDEDDLRYIKHLFNTMEYNIQSRFLRDFHSLAPITTTETVDISSPNSEVLPPLQQLAAPLNTFNDDDSECGSTPRGRKSLVLSFSALNKNLQMLKKAAIKMRSKKMAFEDSKSRPTL